MAGRLLQRISAVKYTRSCLLRMFSLSPACKSEQVVVPVQPTGDLHLGHYFSIIRPTIELQMKDCNNVMVCIADTCALSFITSKELLQENVLKLISIFMACGLEPSVSTLYKQSQVLQQSQMDWILHCLLHKPELESFCNENSVLRNDRDITLGHLSIPVNISADILLFKAALVPAGESFTPYIGLASKLAELLNKSYSLSFPTPRPYLTAGSHIMSLRNPAKRMSRSDPVVLSAISLFDSPEVITEKCKKAITDFTSEVYYDKEKRPGVSNLMTIHKNLTGKDFCTIKKESAGMETAQYKFVVADCIINCLTPIQQKMRELLKEKSHLQSTLKSGCLKAEIAAEQTMAEIYSNIGFQPRQGPTSTTFIKNREHEDVEKNVVKKRKFIFSGIQPTGILHLGNYIGAVKQWVDLQEEGHDVMVSIVDQHAITKPQRCDMLYDSTLAMAASVIACGVDPDRSMVFQQSKVPHHSQLNVVLRCIVHVALLERQSHYKDKIRSMTEPPTMGLFSYPVLQTADIVLYQATHVPVGDDNLQHIQLARQIVRQFTQRYGKLLREPRPMVLDDSLARLRSLKQPSKKMSKSEEDHRSRIEILDSAESIMEKITSAITERGCVGYDPDAKPSVSNLIAMHSKVTGQTVENICEEYATYEMQDYKRVVADALIEHLNPIRQKAQELLEDKERLIAILDRGSYLAKLRSQKTMIEVQKIVGNV